MKATLILTGFDEFELGELFPERTCGSFFTLSKRKGLPASFRLKTARSTTSRTKERPAN
jgi:hypothetical protein